MLAILAPLAFALLQGDLVGQLSPEEFVAGVNRTGFAARMQKHLEAMVSDRGEKLTLNMWLAGRPSGDSYVGGVSFRVDFDLPKSLPKETIKNWQKANGFESYRIHSFLGGKVVLEGSLVYPKTTWDDVRKTLSGAFGVTRSLTLHLQGFGGKRAKQNGEIGTAPLEPEFVLTDVEPEDLDYLRVKLDWGETARPGGGKFWMTGAHPLGQQIIFSKSPRPGFEMTRMGTDPAIAKRLEPLQPSLNGLKVLVQENSYWIQSEVDVSGGMTVASIKQKVEEFARKVKELTNAGAVYPSLSTSSFREAG